MARPSVTPDVPDAAPGVLGRVRRLFGLAPAADGAVADATAPLVAGHLVAQGLRELPRITRHDELPEFHTNLTAVGGALEVREADRRAIAVLATDADTVVLFRNLSTDDAVLAMIQQRARQRGIVLGRVLACDEQLLAACYDATPSARIAPEERSDAVDMFEDILRKAILKNASDIHLQCYRDGAAVKLRVHGKLIYLHALGREKMIALANAMFTLADVDSRQGQTSFHKEAFHDCALTRTVYVPSSSGEKLKVEVKLRWASAPVYPDSFDITLRVLHLGAEGKVKDLAQLGYSPAQVTALTAALTMPVGGIVLVGATGSGKSTTNTTLSNMWTKRNPGKLLRTIEEPAEYIIPDARQVSISRAMDREDTKSDSTMLAKALKAALRMDPDAIYVGEIRDNETAELATKAIMTGHKVFTTLHANSPFAAVDRLVRMGIGRHEITEKSFLNAVVYQTLLPVLCPHCRVRFAPACEADVRRPGDGKWFTRDFIDEMKRTFNPGEISSFYFQGEGCDECAGGIIDRTVAAEILMPDRELQLMLLRDQAQFAYAYWRGGLSKHHPDVQGRTVLDQAIDKVREGQVSALDVYRALGAFSANSDAGTEAAWFHDHFKPEKAPH